MKTSNSILKKIVHYDNAGSLVKANKQSIANHTKINEKKRLILMLIK